MVQTGEQAGGLKTPRKKITYKALLYGLVILFSGMIIGSAATVGVFRTGLIWKVVPRPHLHERVKERLQKDLDLTDEQAERVDKILRNNRREMFQKLKPQFEAEMEKMRSEVEAELTREQARKWNKHFKRMVKFWKRDATPPPPPPMDFKPPRDRKPPRDIEDAGKPVD